jgi:hypothetical protein
MTETLSLRLSDVLYRTRGRDWDYGFVLQPKPLLREGWYALHRRIFSNVEPTPRPLLLRGSLGVGTGAPFFATAFTDVERRDSQGRPVAHYVTWLGADAESAPGASFGGPFVAALGPALDSIFALSPEQLQQAPHGSDKPLDTLLRARFNAALTTPALSLVCPDTSPIRWLGTLAV